jgi:predicted nucleotidyltransferase
MKRHLQTFQEFINEAKDPTYYQETFYFTILISMNKDKGGSRDETKNDIRALAEILTVTLVESEKGGIQRDIGGKYLSTLKVHCRKPKDANKQILIKRIVSAIGGLRGVTVLRYKERKQKPRRKTFRGSYKITEIDYQKQIREKPAHHASMKKRLIGRGGNRDTGGGKGHTRPSMKRSPSAPGPYGAVGEGLIDEDIVVTVAEDPPGLMAFDVQSHLNQKIWDGDKDVHPEVKAALMDIIDEFLEELDLETGIHDIVITGSLANYNWSRFSDIDLHILVDFAAINENEHMVKKFFDAMRSRWNRLHDIRVKGHEVEIYVQNEDEPHTSTGVYSLVHDRWLTKPQKIKPEIDKATAQKKMASLAKEIDKLHSFSNNGMYERVLESAVALKDKIGRMRKSGLEKSGIYSPENLAFKMLRRSGHIQKLFDIYTKSYDQVYSLDQ